jgi:hypothetical protein
MPSSAIKGVHIVYVSITRSQRELTVYIGKSIGAVLVLIGK